MDDFNFNNYGSNDNENYNTSKISSFYTESYRKPTPKRNNTLMQLIAVALVSSILGGAVVGGFLYFVVPVIKPSATSYFDKFLPKSVQENTAVNNENNGIYKKIEIQKTDSAVTAIAEKASPSIVGIRVTFKSADFFFGEQQGKGEGSGIIIKNDGYIMTNYHVVQDAVGRDGKVSGKIEVFLPNQKDKPYEAQLIGGDSKTDLAVIKINASNLPAAELGNSDELKVGELAVAIGNPGGLEYMGSVTVGVISGLNRTIPIEDNKQLKLIQTDAAINPGNSGGALVNSQGQIIGVNTAKIGAQGFEGLGFAIPINKAKEITDSLISSGYVKGRPLLDIFVDPSFNEETAKRYEVPVGVLVADVSPLSNAYKAGIQKGDIITKLDGQPVKNKSELDELKNKHKPGETVEVEIYRHSDNSTKKLQVQLSEDKGN